MTGSDKYVKIVLSTDAKPTGAFPGQLIIEKDTGLVYEWAGESWLPRTDSIMPDLLVKSMPTTETFHYLSHLGKVFIHSERHDAIANGASHDMLVRIPAGNANRQVHFRFSSKAKANTGVLDVDVLLYKGITVSADGAAEPIVSTNDAVVKSTGVTMFSMPTITDLGNYKGQGVVFGENKSTGTQDMAVPEFVMAPNGSSARDYLVRATNNSGGTVDILHNLFFYDSEAA